MEIIIVLCVIYWISGNFESGFIIIIVVWMFMGIFNIDMWVLDFEMKDWKVLSWN